jgi:putative OmpL-like beta-barrel porin-2
MGRIHSLLVAAILGLTMVARADDRSVDAPKKADGSEFLGLIPLSAGNMMADAPPPATPGVPPPATPPAEPPKGPAPQEWVFKGWAEVAHTWNTNDPHADKSVTTPGGAPRESKENSLRVFDVNNKEFMLHQVAFDLEKVATESNWIGFRTVVLAGQDAKWIHSAGLFDGGTGAVSGGGEDIDLPDAYINIKVPKRVLPVSTTFKVGKFETIFGYEVIRANDSTNYNYSRSMLFGYAIPFTHTGVGMDNAWVEDGEGNEIFGTGLHIVNGWDNVKDSNDSKGYMGQVRLAPCKFFKAGANMMFSPEQPNDNTNWRGLFDFTATLTPLDGFDIGGNYDYGYEERVPDPFGGANLGYCTWYGFAGYVKYRPVFSDLLKKWYLGFRGEWFNDPEGIRTLTRVDNPAFSGVNALSSSGSDFVDLTATIGYQPLESLLVRFEYRWDKADQDVYNDHDGTLRNYQNTFAIDLVVSY